MKQASILVFQMGKVGSSSVYHKLKDLGLDPIHFHAMANSKRFKKLGKKQFEAHPFKIITLIRDPVARNLSGYWAATHKNGKNPNIDHLLKYKIEWIDSHLKRAESPCINWVLKWFDREIKPYFNIDVYATPFPKDLGYKYYSHGNNNMVLIRTENLNSIGPNAISKLININFKGMHNINTATENRWAIKLGKNQVLRKYKKFKNSLKLPRYYLDKMYNSEMVKHFYSPEEIKSFYDKWA